MALKWPSSPSLWMIRTLVALVNWKCTVFGPPCKLCEDRSPSYKPVVICRVSRKDKAVSSVRRSVRPSLCVCASVCFHWIFWIDWYLNLSICMCICICKLAWENCSSLTSLNVDCTVTDFHICDSIHYQNVTNVRQTDRQTPVWWTYRTIHMCFYCTIAL